MTASSAAAPRWRRVEDPAGAGAAALGFALVGALAFDDGGYWPSAWAWLAIAAWSAVVLALLLLGRPEVSRPGAVFAVAALALWAWTALSTTWSVSVGRSVFEAERTGAYAGVAVACALLVRRRHAGPLLAGAWAAIVAAAVYALATRLFPERLGVYDPESGYRLAEPVGYSNALGILCALGLILAVTRAATGGETARAAAGASLVVLATAMYFTFSRGAWVAAALGLAVAVAADPRRLRLLAAGTAVLVPPAAAIALAASSDALVDQTSRLQLASAQGHRLAVALLPLAALGAGLAWWLGRVEPGLRMPPRLRRLLPLALVALALVLAGAAFVFGGRAADAFSEPVAADVSLNERLFSFSGSDRGIQWRIAWEAFEGEPLHGTGAGTYELDWMRERPLRMKIRDAHNLYAEVLGELGMVGLGLLAALVAAPFLALRALRDAPFAPAAAGVWTAFVAHAGIDWDWEVPAVTVTALLAGGSLAAAVGGGRLFLERARVPATVAAAAVALGAVAALAGNSPLRAANDAAARGNWRDAEDAARRADTWLPWTSDALQVLAEAQLADGRRGEAARTFREAIARDPSDWELWDGVARATTGRERAAAAARARRLNPLG